MFSTVLNRGGLAERVAGLVEQGKLKVVVDSVYEMEDGLAVSQPFLLLSFVTHGGAKQLLYSQ